MKDEEKLCNSTCERRKRQDNANGLVERGRVRSLAAGTGEYAESVTYATTLAADCRATVTDVRRKHEGRVTACSP